MITDNRKGSLQKKKCYRGVVPQFFKKDYKKSAKVREHESEGSLDYFLLKMDEYMISNGVK